MKQFHSLLTVILIFQVNLLVQGQTNPNASVDCSIDGLVTIDITNVLNPEEWASNQDEWRIVNSVNDSACKPTEFNDTTATVSYSFNVSVCNTSVEEKGGDIVVTFMIKANVVGNSPTKSYDNAFNITCIYNGDGTVTGTFVPLHEVSDNAQDSSELDYNMDVFVAGAQAPSDIPLGTEIEVRVSVDSSFQGTLDLLLGRCYTTYNGSLGEFNLISNSCPDNNTQPDTITNYNCTSQTDYTETFFFSVFRYATQPAGANITITCDVYVCLSTNDSSTCQTNCEQCSNIKRRDIGDEFTDMKVQVSAGPYRFVEDENEQKASNEERQEEPGPSTGLIVGVSVVAVLAAIILCVVVILVLRRGQKGITATSEIAQENPGCECERIATI